jgi:CheY-like chemotaxis protein
MRVLVVDDEAGMRFLLRTVFERAGYEVVEAHDGADALGRVSESRPDLVVTDLMMPVMDGQALIGCLRSNPETASIPILATTALPTTMPDGADAALAKPFGIAELLETARSLVRGGG